jgi:hypothetical protein
MNPSHPQPETRRAFFVQLGRLGAFGALGLLTGSLVARRRVTLPNQDCTNKGVCRGCDAFADCGLPSALYTKRAMEQGKQNGHIAPTGGDRRG